MLYEVITITSDFLGRNTYPSQLDAWNRGNRCWQQTELDILGNGQFTLLFAGGDQPVCLLCVAPGNPDLAGNTLEQFNELIGKYPLRGPRKCRQDTDRLAFDGDRCMGEGEYLLPKNNFCGFRFADEVAVIDQGDVVGSYNFV